MDIARPDLLRRQRIRRISLVGGAGVVLGLATLGVSRLEPAAPRVARASVWVDAVERGEMLRLVRGSGTLVPREVRWIAAQTDGRVERVLVRPGAVVEPGTVLVELSNADLVQQADEANLLREAAEADLAERRLRLRSQQLDQHAALAAIRADYESARLQAEAEKALAAKGIVPRIEYRRSALEVEQLETRLAIERERTAQFAASIEAQVAAQRARVDQARNLYGRRLAQVESLRVRAGLGGVLQEVLVEEGQRVMLGTNIARVARPDDLMAQLRVPEMQARDVQHGQRVAIDTRNGIVEGRIARIDPAVQSGSVEIDVALVGKLPRGARPDLSVEGTIEIERLVSVVQTGRPAYGQPHSTINLFKLAADGDHAVRVSVELGRTSVNTVEIVRGLEPGDEVILSDTSAWSGYDRIRLN